MPEADEYTFSEDNPVDREAMPEGRETGVKPPPGTSARGGGQDVLLAGAVIEIEYRGWAGVDERPRLYFFASLRPFRSQQ